MQRRSLDFVSGQLADYRRFRVLNLIDDHSRCRPGQIVDLSISAARIACFPDDLALRVGPPEEIVLDDGAEGTRRAVFDWSERTAVRRRFIEPPLSECKHSPAGRRGKPVENAFVESFNGKFRDERPNLCWFRSLSHACEEIDRWRVHYSTERPHSALGYLSPKGFLNTTAASTLEPLAVPAPSLDARFRPEISRRLRP